MKTDSRKKQIVRHLKAIIFISVILIINKALCLTFMLSGLTRIIFHELEDEKSGYECVIYGQSHTSYAVDADIVSDVSGVKTMNAGIGGANMMDIYYMILDMYDYYIPDVVVLDLDYQYFLNVDLSDISESNTLIYYNYPNNIHKIKYAMETLPKKDYRASLFKWMNYRDGIYNMKDNLQHKLSDEYRYYDISSVNSLEACDSYKGHGFLYRDRSFVRDNEARMIIPWDEANVDYDYSPRYFKKIVKLCREKGSKVVLLTSPINKETLLINQQSMDNYTCARDYIQKLADENGLEYYDFNLIKDEIYHRESEDYWDYDGHMYGDAAERYSIFLGDFLKKIYKGENISQSQYFYTNVQEMLKCD
ncbi:MAG: hypothetical protein SO361_08440 [Lachnospira sp.]|nr:hypothetical protein [Lachnospira sp.]